MRPEDLIAEGPRWRAAADALRRREALTWALFAALFAIAAWRAGDPALRAGAALSALAGVALGASAWRTPPPGPVEALISYREALARALEAAPRPWIAPAALAPGSALIAAGLARIAARALGPGAAAIAVGLVAAGGIAWFLIALWRGRADRIAELAARLDTVREQLGETPIPAPGRGA